MAKTRRETDSFTPPLEQLNGLDTVRGFVPPSDIQFTLEVREIIGVPSLRDQDTLDADELEREERIVVTEGDKDPER